jgi:hypothetical protein
MRLTGLGETLGVQALCDEGCDLFSFGRLQGGDGDANRGRGVDSNSMDSAIAAAPLPPITTGQFSPRRLVRAGVLR